MVWDHLSPTKPHWAYLILGGFTSLFMLCSSVIKERMYIGEATVATLCGVIFGPHAINVLNPFDWGGSVDLITIEFSRIVLVVQCFAVGVELPKFYMEKHWRSVFFLLVPVMTVGWLATSLFIWWLVPPLNWLESLVVAACVTATDPVLASSVVGKGKFAKRVPKHLRDLLSAESGCNDGMAFPFIYLALYLIQDKMVAGEVTLHWLCITILYECIGGAVFGFLVGWCARKGIRFAEKYDLIDRESFLVFYFVLALFGAGTGSMLGMDDLLIGFAAGVGFSNDGWFTQKTEESHVSNVIDLLLNLAYFVFLGSIIPWEMYNDYSIGLSAWRLVVIAIFVILFRRIPIMMALKPIIPDVKTWREALFAGHFGPIGVGAIFVAILARSELAFNSPVPLTDDIPTDSANYNLIVLIWPIVTFLVISSIVVHGSSIAVFTLGKHINTLTLTLSYTQAADGGPSWMDRLPRISSTSRSQARTMSDTDMDDLKMPDFPPGTLPPVGLPGNFLRRQKEENWSKPSSRASSLVSRRRRRKKWDDGIGPGGPVSESAIFPRRSHIPTRQETSATLTSETLGEKESEKHSDEDRPEDTPNQKQSPPKVEVYQQGDDIIIENEDGDVLAVHSSQERPSVGELPLAEGEELDRRESRVSKAGSEKFDWTLDGFKKRISDVISSEVKKRKEKSKEERRHEPARAYQFGNTVIVEDEDGEVVKTWDLNLDAPEGQEEEGPSWIRQGLKYAGMGALAKEKSPEQPEGELGITRKTSVVGSMATRLGSAAMGGRWRNFTIVSGDPVERARKKSIAEKEQAEDDRHIRFTIGGVGQRLTKEDFIRKMQTLDARTRGEIVDKSSASHVVKTLAKHDPQQPQEPKQPQQQRRASITSQASSYADAAESSKLTSRASESHASEGRSRSSSPHKRRGKEREEEPETAVEMRRRLAVLEQGDEGETPAERRRREAALGMGAPAEEDSDDEEGTERVPPTRRGIRFADVPERGRK